MRLSEAIYRASEKRKSTKLSDRPRDNWSTGGPRGVRWEVQHSEDEKGYRFIRLYHWGTLMAVCRANPFSFEWKLEHWHYGHNSVSDQTGLNELFSGLGMPYYATRKGGVLDLKEYKNGVYV